MPDGVTRFFYVALCDSIIGKQCPANEDTTLIVQERLLSLLLFYTKQNSYLVEANRDLRVRRHNVVTHHSVSRVQSFLLDHHTDAIVAADEPELEALLNTLKTMYQRPLICVLTHEPAPPAHLADLDDVLVLPYLPAAFIESTVRHHLSTYSNVDSEKHQDEITLLKNAIVRNVSHELKTPLLQVKSAVALIAEETKDDRLTKMAVQATARLETIVKNITLLADSMNAQFGPVIAHESIEQAMRNLRRSWTHKDAISRVKITQDDDIPPVLADKQGLSIVMQQLIDNALKFSPDKQFPVEVQLRRQSDSVQIAVKDYGIGIAQDKLKQIFESFYQIDSSVTRRYGGTGVGLAIVRLILDKHGADIHVESTLGEGSTFSFDLPEAEI